MSSKMDAIDRLGQFKNKLFALSFLDFPQASSSPEGAAGLSFLIRDFSREAESIEDALLADAGNLKIVSSK